MELKINGVHEGKKRFPFFFTFHFLFISGDVAGEN